MDWKRENQQYFLPQCPPAKGTDRAVLARRVSGFSWAMTHSSILTTLLGHQATPVPVAPITFTRQGRRRILTPFNNISMAHSSSSSPSRLWRMYPHIEPSSWTTLSLGAIALCWPKEASDARQDGSAWHGGRPAAIGQHYARHSRRVHGRKRLPCRTCFYRNVVQGTLLVGHESMTDRGF